MIRIKSNNLACDEHLKFLKQKIEDRIKKILEDKKDILVNDETKACLICIKNNLEIILKANPDELKKIIKYFQIIMLEYLH